MPKRHRLSANVDTVLLVCFWFLVLFSPLQLQDLPSSLTALTSLQELRVTSVANIPQHIVANGSASLLGHLGLAHYQGHAPAAPTANGTEERRLQMVTFGPKDSGKTALLAQLTGKRFDIADPAIHCLTVSCRRSVQGSLVHSVFLIRNSCLRN